MVNAAKSKIDGIKEELKQVLIYPGEFTIAVDLWKDQYIGNHYVGIVAHYNIEKNNSVQRKSVVLNADKLDVMTKTNESIREYIRNLFSSKFDIDVGELEDKVKKVCDRGKNVSIALDGPIHSVLHCYCHLINNLVEAMVKIESAKKIISNASTLVNYLKTSGMNSFLSKTVKSNVPTRWNTVFFMLSSIVDSFDQILQILHKKETETKNYIYVKKITCLNRDEIISMSKFLELFYKLSVPLESENKPTLDRVWPTYRRIRLALGHDLNDSELLKTMKSAGSDYIDKNLADFEPSMQHKLALFLHPLHKNLHFALQTERSEVQHYAESRMDCYFNGPTEDNNNTEPTVPQDEDDIYCGLNGDDTGGRNSLLDEIMNYHMFSVRKVILI